MTPIPNIVRSSTANAIGIGLSAAVQLISVPVLASIWGAATYGVWLMLTTIPTYLALTDFGFVEAGTSDMTMKAARNERRAIVEVFSSILVLFTAAAAIVNLIVAVLIWGAYGAGFDWAREYQLSLHLLTFYSSLAVISRVNLAGFRANGLYATGTVSYDSLAFIEVSITLAVVVFHGGFAAAITAMIVCRLVNILSLYGLLRYRLPWLSFRMDAVSGAELRRLLEPAASGMAIPLSLAIILQGTVLLVGSVISPAAAAVFSSVRTISRIAIQIVGIVNRASMPEIAQTMAKGDRRQIGRLVLLNCALAVFVLVPAGIIFALFGSTIVGAWTHDSIQPDNAFVAAMALAMVVHGGWYLVSNMLLATNSHSEFARIIVMSAPLTAVLVYAGASWGGLFGAACAIVLGEGFCLAGAFRALRHTPFNPGRLWPYSGTRRWFS